MPKSDITIRLQTEADRDIKQAVAYGRTFDALITQIFQFPAPERKLPAVGELSPSLGSETARD